MKNLKLVLLVVLSGLTSQAFAQFSVGIRGSYVKAWEEYGNVGLPDDAQIHVHGFQVSALAYYSLNKYLQVGIEPGFVRRGAACEPGFIIFNNDTKLLLNYVELPIMLKGRLPLLNNKLEIFGKVGYGVSRLTSAHRELMMLGTTEPPIKIKLDVNNNESLNNFDHGLYGGLGVGFNMGKNQLFLEANFYHGMKDVDTWNTSKNRSMQLGAGYMIGF